MIYILLIALILICLRIFISPVVRNDVRLFFFMWGCGACLALVGVFIIDLKR
jgi:hypothetical protein